MMNKATLNVYLDMLGISHAAAAEECAVDCETMELWCTGMYAVPRGVEKWILRRLEEHDVYVQEICSRARLAADDENMVLVPCDQRVIPRNGGNAAASEAMNKYEWQMAAVKDAVVRLRSEGYTVILDYRVKPDRDSIEAADRIAEGCLDIGCPHAIYDGYYNWTCSKFHDDIGPFTDSCFVGRGESEPDPNFYDRYVLDEDGVYIGDDLLIKAVIDGEIEQPRWMPDEDVEAYKRGVRKNLGSESDGVDTEDDGDDR